MSDLRPVKTAVQRKSLRQLFAQGEHWLHLTGAALAIALLMITGLLFIVVKNGVGYFWPRDLVQIERGEESPMLGIIVGRQAVRTDSTGADSVDAQVQVRVANRDVFAADYVWVKESSLGAKTEPPDAVAVERWQQGDLYGFLVDLKQDGKVVAEGAGAWGELQRRIDETRGRLGEISKIRKHQIPEITVSINKANAEINRVQRTTPDGAAKDATIAEIKERIAKLKAEADELRSRSDAMQKIADEWSVQFRLSDGQTKDLLVANIFAAHKPNSMSIWQKFWVYCQRAVYFVSGEPRESNTEGGVWPALFGTVMMTILMSVAVTPFGVLAALYLREYAKQGPIVRAVRIAINNLAGVPSIVFGVFGLGFFVYFVGGWIDQKFYADALPAPTFGTGGILWASLTLALLTVPVVIVATEESLASVPRGVREGSLALGASKFQTICRVVLPAAVPGILTGVILAMARGAGEVAPLMITGVVKVAPEMPFDLVSPFLHVERKFMHLGFHIFDVGFQSPNVEAAKPMVFTTTLLLIGIVILLNIVAIRARDRIRKKFAGGAFG